MINHHAPLLAVGGDDLQSAQSRSEETYRTSAQASQSVEKRHHYRYGYSRLDMRPEVPADYEDHPVEPPPPKKTRPPRKPRTRPRWLRGSETWTETCCA